MDMLFRYQRRCVRDTLGRLAQDQVSTMLARQHPWLPWERRLTWAAMYLFLVAMFVVLLVAAPVSAVTGSAISPTATAVILAGIGTATVGMATGMRSASLATGSPERSLASVVLRSILGTSVLAMPALFTLIYVDRLPLWLYRLRRECSRLQAGGESPLTTS